MSALPFKPNSRSGFTLVELLVSLGIIVIILSFTLASINSARVRSRDAKRVADLQTIQAALEQHSLGDSTHSYPYPPNAVSDPNSADYKSYCPEVTTGPKGGIYTNPCFSSYLAVVPKDPRGGQYDYVRQACFVVNDMALGGIELKANIQTPADCLNSRIYSYGLHTVLESTNNPEGIKDVTPANQQSYDLAP